MPVDVSLLQPGVRWECYWPLEGRDQRCCQASDRPQTKSCLVSSVSGSEDENPWPRG